MISRSRNDEGQAFPIYVVMVAGLLFLAFAFFAVGKASALRNGSQGAADAAALAAAQSARDDLGTGFYASLPANTLDLFLGAPFAPRCDEAGRLADINGTDLRSCIPAYGYLRDRITVDVEGRRPVDSSVLPGSESKFAKAKATALIEFRCPRPKAVDLNSDGVQDLFIFTCRNGEVLEIAPGSPPPWESVSRTLFDVRLVDQ
ncbi:pilus assembly protein TadG-related protein [Streptomyces sp. C11-1]|uniref:Pilus assembly protein TadG-related protein n=1 Tax=Streptomyces durocortorensis TaxID=2811104 RepID=A0ABY9W5C2_9ACTN|nr:pilus assembly protein TadG-related protein [Streptomyces durocortorensis]WNF31370.1 pilus assembly protein TadG-related protein [Streptomyces durocortorensis]